jgi:hypothetical protein
MNPASKPTRKYRHLLAISVVSALSGAVWLFYGSDAWVTPYLRANWLRWFNVEWFQDTEWRSLVVFGTVLIGPVLGFGALTLWAYAHYYYANFATIHETNLLELEKAKAALQQSLVSVSTIEREYKGKLESYQQLQKQLEELQSVKKIDTEDLRKKLNAIAAASRSNVWFERSVGFFIGVLSSLFAAYVWERLHAI